MGNGPHKFSMIIGSTKKQFLILRRELLFFYNMDISTLV